MLVEIGCVLILILFLVVVRTRVTERYDADTGLEWLQQSLLSLDPSLCVETTLAIDPVAIREGRYAYYTSPADMMTYKEMLQGETDMGAAFDRTDNSYGQNRATIALNKKSPYYDVLSRMDEHIQMHQVHLNNMSPWYLKGKHAGDVTFASISGPVIDGVSKTPDGVIVWQVRTEVAADPSGKAFAVFTLMSFARLLLLINYAVADMKQIKEGKAIEDRKTSSFMSNLGQAEKDVKQSLDSERLAADNNLRNSDIENINELRRISGHIMDSQTKTLAARTGMNEHNMTYNSIAQKIEGVKTRNYDVQKNIEAKTQRLVDVNEDVARLEASAAKIRLDVELRLTAAHNELDDIEIERKQLQNLIAETTSKVNQLTRDLVFWKDPGRLNASNADANLAYQELEYAKTDLANLENDKERLKNKKDAAQKNLAKLNAELETTKNLESSARANYETDNANLINARSRLEASQNFVDESKIIQEQRSALESQMNDLKTQISALTYQLTTITRVDAKAYENALNLLGDLKAKYRRLSDTLNSGLNMFEPIANNTALPGIANALSMPPAPPPAPQAPAPQAPAHRAAYKRPQTFLQAANRPAAPAPAPAPARGWGPVLSDQSVVGMRAYKYKEFDSKKKMDKALEDCRSFCVGQPECNVMVLENPKNGNYKCWLGRGADAQRQLTKAGRKTTQRYVR